MTKLIKILNFIILVWALGIVADLFLPLHGAYWNSFPRLLCALVMLFIGLALLSKKSFARTGAMGFCIYGMTAIVVRWFFYYFQFQSLAIDQPAETAYQAIVVNWAEFFKQIIFSLGILWFLGLCFLKLRSNQAVVFYNDKSEFSSEFKFANVDGRPWIVLVLFIFFARLDGSILVGLKPVFEVRQIQSHEEQKAILAKVEVKQKDVEQQDPETPSTVGETPEPDGQGAFLNVDFQTIDIHELCFSWDKLFKIPGVESDNSNRYFGEQIIIDSVESYADFQEKISMAKNIDCAAIDFPEIDFSQKIMVGQWAVGSCATVDFEKKLLKNEDRKEIMYSVKAIEASKRCSGPGFASMNFIVTDKIPADYTLTFQQHRTQP